MSGLYQVLAERGFLAQSTDEERIRSLLEQERVTGYIGFDPTAPSLHAGSLLPLMALSHLQRAGHRPLAILGGGTAMIGDPSGKSEMRQMLTREQIESNREALRGQIARFISLDADQGLLIDNGAWLLNLELVPFLRDIGSHFSVNRMLSFEAYKMRLERGLSFLEFSYQLFQAYDFLVLFREQGCKLQLGGDDQWGNIVAGIDLIRRVTGEQAYGLTFPLLQTSSGQKMGKTAQGAVWLDAERTSPYQFYQYFRNTDDADVGRFLAYFTYLPMDEVGKLAALEGQEKNTAKEVLAFEVTRIVHGEQAAQEARTGARAAFGVGAAGSEHIPTTKLSRERLQDGIDVVQMLCEVGLSPSRSEARRLIQQGGARVGERKVETLEDRVSLSDLDDGAVLIRAGKKKFHRVVLDD